MFYLNRVFRRTLWLRRGPLWGLGPVPRPGLARRHWPTRASRAPDEAHQAPFVPDLVRRPLVVVGPLLEHVSEKLVHDFPHKFTRCIPEIRVCSQADLEAGVQSGDVVDYRRRGTHFEATLVSQVKEICDKVRTSPRRDSSVCSRGGGLLVREEFRRFYRFARKMRVQFWAISSGEDVERVGNEGSGGILNAARPGGAGGTLSPVGGVLTRERPSSRRHALI